MHDTSIKKKWLQGGYTKGYFASSSNSDILDHKEKNELYFYCGVIGIESGLQVIPFSEVVRLYIVTLFYSQYYSDFYYGTHVHWT